MSRVEKCLSKASISRLRMICNRKHNMEIKKAKTLLKTLRFIFTVIKLGGALMQRVEVSLSHLPPQSNARIENASENKRPSRTFSHLAVICNSQRLGYKYMTRLFTL